MSTAMQTEYINYFITSLVQTFRTMLSCEVTRGPISLKEDPASLYEVSGVVGLSGKAAGTVVVSLSKNVALRAASALLLSEATEVDDDVIDAAGELTNVIAGRAKSELEQYEMFISLPNVITGVGHEIRFPSNVPPICVPFETEWGPLTLEVGLEEVMPPIGT